MKVKFQTDLSSFKKIDLVAVAYSKVERELFATQEAYDAEIEVEERAQEVVDRLIKMGVNARGYAGDQYFLTNLLVDKPDFVINLVDTLRGKDALSTSVPAALELSNIPYTGAGMEGFILGNNRNLTKRVLLSYDIPTPDFQFIRRIGTTINRELGLPLIVKLNESGGSVGIDNKAVKESYEDAEKKVAKMMSTYKIPVVVERFIGGPEVTVIVFDDGNKKHVFMGQKVFKEKADGKHYFTSFESYDDFYTYKYKLPEGPIVDKIRKMAVRAFNGLYHKDYGKFDIRVDEDTNTPYFIDSNPNTAFGPSVGLPLVDVLELHGIEFDTILQSLISKYAKNIT